MQGITAIAIEDIPAYEGPHAIEKIRFRPARKALGVRAWGMNVLELDAHCEGYPLHDHEGDGQEEVYVVLHGSVTLQAQGERLELRTGSCVRVAPSVKRKLVTGAESVTVLAIGGTPGKAYEPHDG